jgi:hypothetical protein
VGIGKRGEGKGDPSGKGLEDGIGEREGTGGLHIQMEQGHEGINASRHPESAEQQNKPASRNHRSGVCGESYTPGIKDDG